MIRRVQTDSEGRALAMELVIGALMANYCRDPEHPTYDEISAVAAELKAMSPSRKQDYRTEQPHHDRLDQSVDWRGEGKHLKSRT
jgi:hypothetical protein